MTLASCEWIFQKVFSLKIHSFFNQHFKVVSFTSRHKYQLFYYRLSYLAFGHYLNELQIKNTQRCLLGEKKKRKT